MDKFEGDKLQWANLHRSRMIKELGLAYAAEGKGLAVSHAKWDGEHLNFFTKPLEPGEKPPQGWYHYRKDYWKMMEDRGF